jgi:hypothetical protein
LLKVAPPDAPPLNVTPGPFEPVGVTPGVLEAVPPGPAAVVTVYPFAKPAADVTWEWESRVPQADSATTLSATPQQSQRRWANGVVQRAIEGFKGRFPSATSATAPV